MTLTSSQEKNLIGSLALALKDSDLAAELMTKAGSVELPSPFVALVHKELGLAKKYGWPKGEKGELLMQTERIFRSSF